MSTGTNTRIDGPLVYLEAPGPEHLPAIWKVYLDAPDYFEALTGSADFDPTAVEMLYEDALSEDSRYYLAIRRTDTKSLVGTIEFEAGADDVPATLRGLVVAQGERGRGYGRAALELAEGFLANDLGVTTIAADVPEGYDDGARFLEALGYRERRLKSAEVRWVKRIAGA
ncbi:MAG: GNAT family N-acetyltransferase [Candidatus Eisenbacteria bacterium]|uniref:GNAT family N-acetyltransferase n=1 Tax=Eiseniibacteriota bacterium TaxID=2212470 RepID=A0A538T488_UNCEI|nr:MAG: GNAT family N-acetyltransferase [Candidatus Eisenbacteria bacterium]